MSKRQISMTPLVPIALGYGVGALINAQWWALAGCAAVIALNFRIATKDTP